MQKHLKEKLNVIINHNRQMVLNHQVESLKQYRDYDDVITTFESILQNKLYDAPLMLEWNIWRAMTMINGGKIQANLKFDDNGVPMNTAQGNMPDIVCDYGAFGVIVEVTMQKGQRQYEAESEPVSRHLAHFKKSINKDAYCLFIAPKINESCIAHFYTLHKINIQYYGGQSIIVPLELGKFVEILKRTYKTNKLTPNQIREIFIYSKEQAIISKDEKQWYDNIQNKILNGIF